MPQIRPLRSYREAEALLSRTTCSESEASLLIAVSRDGFSDDSRN